MRIFLELTIAALIFLMISCDSQFSTQQAEIASSGASVVSAGQYGSAQANRTGLPVDSNISIKLTSEPLPNSVNDNSLFVTKENKSTFSLTENDFDSISCNHDRKLDLSIKLEGADVTLDPLSNLECSTTYFICLTKEIRFLNENTFNGKTFSFTTEACRGTNITFNDGVSAVNTNQVDVNLSSDGAIQYIMTEEQDCGINRDWQNMPVGKNVLRWILPGIDLSTPTPNKTVSIYAKFRNDKEIETPCVKGDLIFDNVAPTISSTKIKNSSPGSTPNPTVILTLSEGAKIDLFDNPSCLFPTISKATVKGAPGINSINAQIIKENIATDLYVKVYDDAKNYSACTAVGSYTYVPNSSAMIAEAGKNFNSTFSTSLIQPTPKDPNFKDFRYTLDGENPSCTSGTIANTDTLIAIPETSTTLKVVSCDTEGNILAQSQADYVFDSTAPTISTPSLSSTKSSVLTTDASFTIDKQATVILFSNSDCTSAPISQTLEKNSGSVVISTNSLTSNSSTDIYVMAIDSAQNISKCSLIGTYTNDSAAPDITSASIVSSSSSTVNPTVQFSLNEDASVTLYNDSSCQNAISNTESKNSGINSMQTTELTPNSSVNIYMFAEDSTANKSSCTLLGSYNTGKGSATTPEFSSPSLAASSGTTLTPTVSFSLNIAANVTLYSDSSCSSAISSSVAKNSGSSTMDTNSLTANSTTNIYAKAIDSNSNSSNCTAIGSYTHSLPEISSASVTTNSPGTILTPTVAFSLNIAATVTLYSDSACSTAISSAVSKASGANSMTTNSLSSNSATSIYAKAIDSNSNSSSCTTIGSYTHNSPAAPQLSSVSVTTTSPGTSLTPSVSFTLNVAATVTLYSDSACSAAISSAVSKSSGTNSMTTNSLNSNSTTSIYAKAIDSNSNSSSCTTIGSYTHSSPTPQLSSVSVTTTSPGTSLTPSVAFTLNIAATVTLYSDSSCSTAISSAVSKASGANSMTTNSLNSNSTTSIYAKAVSSNSNSSNCTLIGSYTHSPTPQFSSVSIVTGSPGNSLTPEVSFTLNVAATVTLYSDSSCSTAISSAISKSSGANSMTTNSLTSNSTTSIYAKALDSNSNSSNCTLIGSYTHSTVVLPTFSSVSVTTTSPGTSLTPTVSFTLNEAATVTLYSDSSCSNSISSGVSKSSGANTLSTDTLTSNSQTAIYAKAVDADLHSSSCTSIGSYTHDSVSPSFSSVSVSTTSPGNTLTPSISFTLSEDASVTLYSDSSCSNSISSSASKNSGANSMATGNLSVNTTVSIYAKASDAAGNASSCASIGSYTNDSAAPSISSLSVSTSSPGTSLTPTIAFTIDENASVTLYSDGSCSSSISSTSSLTSGSKTMSTNSLSPNASTTIYLKAIDSLENASNCTSVGTYVNDTVAPTPSGSISLTPSSTNISISWSEASDSITTTGNLSYKVVYNSSASNINTVNSANTNSLIALDWSSAATSAIASDLTASTAYAFAVLVKDQAGNMGLYTPVSTTTLTADSTVPTVSNATITSTPGMTNMGLSWNASSDNRDSASLLQYRVYQGVSTAVLTASAISTSLSEDDGDVTPISDWMKATTSYTATGLIPNTTYYFNIVVKDTTGNENNYTAASFLTSSDSESPSLGTGITYKAGVTSAYLKWGAGTDNATPTSLLTYKVVKASNSSDIDSLAKIASASVVANFSTAMLAVNATGLTANTDYAFAIVVSDQAGNLMNYSPITLRTLTSDSTPPEAGSEIVATPHSASVDLSWGDATDNASPSENILYRVMQDGVAASDWTVGMTTATITELQEGHSYTFSVQYKDGAGNSGTDYDDVVVSTLTDNLPPNITNSTASSNSGPTYISLSWTAATDGISSAANLQYKVVQASSTSDISTVEDADIAIADQTSTNFIAIDWTSNITSATVADLTKNTSYAFAIIVRDEAGNMALYTPLSVSTTNPADGTAPTPNATAPTTSPSADSSGVPNITVTWTNATDNITTASNLKYQLVMSDVESSIDSVSKALSATVVKSWFSTSSTSISGTASNLASGTVYSFAIIVKDQAENMAIYQPVSETTDIGGSGVITLSSLPSGETTKSITLKTLFGNNAGFYFQRDTETEPYYYQYVAGKTRNGGTKYNQYLLKFSLGGVLQSGFGTNGWANIYNATNLPNDSSSTAFHWQVCNSKIYMLAYNNNSSYKLYQATLGATTATFSTSLGTISFATSELLSMSCVNNKVYIIGNSSGDPLLYALDTSNNSLKSGSAVTAGTLFNSPFIDSNSNLWVLDWESSTPGGFFSKLDTNLAYVNSSKTSLGIGNFPLTSFPVASGDVRNGFFGAVQNSSSDTLLYTGASKYVKIWNTSADNILSYFAAGTVTPNITYTSSSVKNLTYGSMLDGRQCKSANKFAGFDYYKFYSSTQSSSNKTWYGYHFYMATSDGARSSFFNRGRELSFRNKNYKGSDGAGKKLISIACDASNSSAAFAFKNGKNYVTVVLMPLDSTVP